ncbi:isoaspartyl peptidase/L-asparaginase family protein [Sandaracinobacteroides saxicola]|nr:isoaspartyl peptidase/L-asparaginase [Sandaracinobacteroides saxicola]
MLLAALAAAFAMPVEAAPDWTLVVHGGAGVITRAEMTPARDKAIRAALNRALDAGQAVLAGGGQALDAVEAAVRVLEDDPNFNAGRGAALTSAGTAELDAAIMDGATRKAGTVTGVTTTKNPIRAARAVMETTPHVMLAGAPADAVAAKAGADQVANGYFITAERQKMLDDMRKSASVFDVRLKYGTVGAVARDRAGNLAAATSTGGLTGKMPGRVGDAPIIGGGTVADNRACAVSGTGSGEMFIRARVAAQICDRIRFGGEKLKPAMDAALAEVKAYGGDGGVIAIDAAGVNGWSFNSDGMYRARVTSDGARQVRIHGDEE